MASLFEINHQGTGGANPERIRIDGKAFQGIYAELAAEFFDGSIVDKGPLVDTGRIIGAEAVFDSFLVAPLDDQFPRVERTQQGCDVIEIPLGEQELSSRRVQECRSALILFEGQAAEEIVFFLFKGAGIEGYAGGDDFRNAPFDQLLGEFGIFQLVAYSDLHPGPDEFRDIIVDGMVGESRHCDRPLLSVRFLGQD